MLAVDPGSSGGHVGTEFDRLTCDNLATIKSFGANLMDLVCRDACDGHNVGRVGVFITVACNCNRVVCIVSPTGRGGSVAEWLACWTQAQKGPGSNRSRDAVG